MNIYNDSNSTTQYPANPIFQSIYTDGLSIKNLQKGSILFGENNTEDVGALVLGPQDYVLQSDAANTGIPIWKNTVKLDYAEMNDLKLTGLVKGDLLVGGDDFPFVSRLPCGTNNQILYSNGVELGWQDKTVGNHYFYFAGGSNNISNVLGPVVGGNGFSLTSGRLYKMTLSAQLDSAVETVHQLWLNSVQVPNLFFLYDGRADMSKTFLYTAAASGALFIELRSATVSGTASIFDFRLFAEEY